jgi:hypothetical protein
MTYKNPLLMDADWFAGKEQNPRNLNDLIIHNADGPDEPIKATRDEVTSGAITVLFDGLIDRLCEEIKRWPAVVGCMAWLTNRAVLEALATREEVCILMQKEDWLRPDSAGWSKQQLRALLDKVKGGSRWTFCSRGYCVAGDDSLPPFMCCGVHQTNKTPPRMHHKFFAFGDFEIHVGEGGWEQRIFKPRVAWTGSLNATENGARSIENAAIIRDEVIASAYHREWETLLGIAEPLNWSTTWVRPVYRIGT